MSRKRKRTTKFDNGDFLTRWSEEDAVNAAIAASLGQSSHRPALTGIQQPKVLLQPTKERKQDYEQDEEGNVRNRFPRRTSRIGACFHAVVDVFSSTTSDDTAVRIFPVADKIPDTNKIKRVKWQQALLQYLLNKNPIGSTCLFPALTAIAQAHNLKFPLSEHDYEETRQLLWIPVDVLSLSLIRQPKLSVEWLIRWIPVKDKQDRLEVDDALPVHTWENFKLFKKHPAFPYLKQISLLVPDKTWKNTSPVLVHYNTADEKSKAE